MRMDADGKYLQNQEEYGLISERDVTTIKIKLGKSHRKEADWTVIKEILSSHNIIALEPAYPDKRLPVKDHILCENGHMVVFTNINDCKKYIRNLNTIHNAPERGFLIGTMLFEDAISISEKNKMELYIDYQVYANEKFMLYVPGEGIIKAVMMVK